MNTWGSRKVNGAEGMVEPRILMVPVYLDGRKIRKAWRKIFGRLTSFFKVDWSEVFFIPLALTILSVLCFIILAAFVAGFCWLIFVLAGL